jgi:hypothetical protein
LGDGSKLTPQAKAYGDHLQLLRKICTGLTENNFKGSGPCFLFRSSEMIAVGFSPHIAF